ncbi:MAG: KilA-N domain-containing protein [Bacillota bacterium]|nr:KilA-N domain-containing protein [Bacillota bacterium]
MTKEIINVKGTQINIFTEDHTNDYISLTDIARYKNEEDPRIVISNWMSSYSTIDFLSVWEELNNPNFNRMEFHTVRSEKGRLVMTPKRWIEKLNGIGIISKPGRYGGTYAHTDIAFEFASWVSPEFKLYIIKEYQRLKTEENNRLSLDWNLNRELTKLNYRIHTDAVKEFIVPALDFSKQKYAYSNEADILNLALFGKTAKQWRQENPNLKGNVRDHASINQLLVLSNLENYNSVLIEQGVEAEERLKLLNKLAITQLNKLNENEIKSLQKIKELNNKNH